MVLPLFVIPLVTITFIAACSAIIKAKNQLPPTLVPANYGLAPTVRLATLLSLNVSLAYSAFLWKVYPIANPDSNSLLGGVYYPSSAWFELQHNLGLPFLMLSTFILLSSLLAAWYSTTNTLLFTVLILFIEICLVGIFSCTNLFVFLLFFEASALPVFILIVYCGSPRRERLKAAYYFLFFTLYGSLSLLLLILNLISLSQLEHTGALVESQITYLAWVLLFIAFAIKIPLFPFHLWLPYAHVEASTPTSIILAALMLKLGGYGILKFMLPLFSIETHLFFRPAALAVCVIGLVYIGVVSLRQLDLKRQLAFSSISHMSLAMLGVFTFTEAGSKGAVYLMLSHGLTSTALFFLVGVLSDRYHTRSVLIYSGLLSVMPLFSGFFILMSLANVGFPGTSGFLPEFFIVVAIVQSSPAVLFPVLFGMVLTTAGSMILLLRLLFGHVKTYTSKSTWVDINKLEFYILIMLLFWVVVLGFSDALDSVN